MTDRYERLNHYIDELLADRSPAPFVAEDTQEREVLQMAAQLRALKPGADLPRRRNTAKTFALIARMVDPRPVRSRRRVVIAAAGGLAAGLFAGLGPAAGLRKAWEGLAGDLRARMPAPRLAGWLQAGRLHDVPQGGALSFTVDNLGGYMLRNGDQLSAFSAICNHWHCHVDWVQAAGEFVCRCDRARFDRAGGSLEDPAEYGGPLLPLTRFAVQVENGIVFIKSV